MVKFESVPFVCKFMKLAFDVHWEPPLSEVFAVLGSVISQRWFFRDILIVGIHATARVKKDEFERLRRLQKKKRKKNCL